MFISGHTLFGGSTGCICSIAYEAGQGGTQGMGTCQRAAYTQQKIDAHKVRSGSLIPSGDTRRKSQSLYCAVATCAMRVTSRVWVWASAGCRAVVSNIIYL